MISDQIKKIKRQQKSILGKSNIHISFSELHDIENETLLELIPISTKYTSRQSLYFDRFRLSNDQEVKFNIKFSKFLIDLVAYVQTPDIEFLYDFLVRKYYVHKFNPKEFIFVLLLHTNYYNQLISVDKYAGLQWFDCQKDYSTHFIAELCIRDKDFFSLYLNYYQYYNLEFVRVFVNEITNLILQKLGPDVLKFVSFFYEIISSLVDIDYKKDATNLYKKIKPFLGDDTQEFVNIIGIVDDEVSTDNVNYNCPSIIQNTDLHEEFKSAQINHNGRKYLQNENMLKKYICYLVENSLKDNSFSEAEVSLLNEKSSTFVSQYRIDEYKDLLKEVSDQSSICKRLLEYPKEEFDKIIENVKSEHWDIVVMKYPASYKWFIDKSNCKKIEAILKDDLELFNDFLNHCLENNYVDIKYFDFQITADEVMEMLKMSSPDSNKVFSLLQISSNRGFKISEFLIENELYIIPIVLDYIAKDIKRAHNTDHDTYLNTLNDDIYYKFLEMINASNLSSIIMICDVKKNNVLTNKLVDYVIENRAYSDLFIEFVNSNLTDITFENIQRFLDSYGYNSKIIGIIEYVLFEHKKTESTTEDKQQLDQDNDLSIDYNIIDRIYKYKAYDVLYELSRKYGFDVISKNLDVKNRQKLLETFYYQGLVTDEDMHSFLLYVSNIMKRHDKKYIEILFNEYKHLIHLYESTNWDFIKIIIIEGMNQNVSQEFFEVFVNNLRSHVKDLDLLSAICRFDIDFTHKLDDENNITLKDRIFHMLKDTPDANVADIIIINTDYCDIRIVPYIAPKLLEHKKTSICKLFKDFRNIMSCYVSQLLNDFPEAYESLYMLDATVLMKKIVEICKQKKFISDLSNKIISTVLFEETLPDSTYQDITSLFIEHINEVSSSSLHSLLTKYKNANILPLVDTLFDNRYDDFADVAHIAVKNMSVYYKKYIQLILEKEGLSSNEYKFISSYLKYLPLTEDITDIILRFDSFLLSYLQDGDMNLAKLIARSLNFVKDKSSFTKKILNNLKEPHTVLSLQLLQSIIRNTNNYKKQIKFITPHLSLLVDSTKSDIARECQNLLAVIDKVYGFNPLIT